MDLTLTLQDSGEHDTKPYNVNNNNIIIIIISFQKNQSFAFWHFRYLFPSAAKYVMHFKKGLVSHCLQTNTFSGSEKKILFLYMFTVCPLIG